MLFEIHREKQFQLFAMHPINHQVSPCYHSLLTVIQNYRSMMTPNGALHVEQ